ncbi:MAG: ATP-binding protein [Candidatus Omnitrophota bacterium]
MKYNTLQTVEEDFYKQDMAYQSRLLCASFRVRIIILLIGVVYVSIARFALGVDVPSQVFTILLMWAATCAVYLIPFKKQFFKTRKGMDAFHFSYYFLTVTYATFASHYLGAAEGTAFFVYLFDLVYANVLLSRARGVFVSALIAVSYFSLILLEYKNIIPHERLFHPDVAVYDNFQYFVTVNIIVIGTLFGFISYSTGIFCKMKEDREKNLIDAKNRSIAKTSQLEQITKALRKKIAENTYLKRAAMGYIEKKEFEIVRTKKDLEEQISKLRKTQNAMFLMIQDLNDMRAQLKDAHDNLEKKVQDRTDELLTISRKLHKSEHTAFLGKLASSVTHELRNPLAVLKNAAYFLDKMFKSKKIDKIKVPKYIEIIQKQISLIDSIVDDIMGFAKTKTPVLTEGDVKDIIEQVIASIKVPEFIKIKRQFKKVPKIKMDGTQLMHALINITNNAIMAMSGSGELTFRTLQKDNYVCIEVEDKGQGIPVDQRDLIFEPLYSSKPKGTGLGLPIAKMMIENQEGRIEFESELGEGTVFKIFLPIVRKGDG